MFDGHGYVAESGEGMTASTDEAREELRNRLPDVLRMAVGLAANPNWSGDIDDLADDALALVIACERVCDYGEDGENG